jgi:two-component system cell cycle response regulator DivK
MPNRSVLVVDDDADNREMLADFLQFAGFEVTTAENGADAVTRAEEVRPAVVLMDLVMPGVLDGWEATRRIKSHPTLNATVVIAVTAHALPADVQKAMHAGCHAVVVKPYDLQALAASVERVIAAREPAGS